MSNNTSYRKIIIPEVILETMLIAKEVNPIDEVNFLKAISIVNEIISKNEIFNRNKDYHILNIPLASKLLTARYGEYKTTKHWLRDNNIVWLDKPFKGKSTYFHIHAPSFYNYQITCLLHFNNQINRNNVLTSYCVRNSIATTTLTTVNKDITEDLKNRIFNNWIELKIPLTTKDVKFLSKVYELESKAINNAPNHVKKMGQYYRKTLRIDFEGAKAFIDKQFSDIVNSKSSEEQMEKAQRMHSSRLSSIKSIDNGKKNKTLRYGRNDTNNRIDTNLTNMAAELRKFIIGAPDMAYLDLKNSQPVLFNIMLKEWIGQSTILDNEIKEYRELTSMGQWYEKLMNIFDCDRKTAKDNWMLVAYSDNQTCKHLKNKIKKYFPELMKVIESYKKVDYEQFSILLQKIESKIFIDKICKELVSNSIFPYTIHDGLMVNKKDKVLTRRIMEKCLEKELGWIPSVKEEVI